MRELLPFALLAFACSAIARQPLGCVRSAPLSAPSAERKATAPATSADATSFATLSGRGAVVAPGMREVARIESTGDTVEILRAERRDECVRVAFEASSPVVARLLDSEGNVIASSEFAAADGVLGQRGPVCVRRGDTVSASTGGADAAMATVRWVAWEAP